tara:strand:- start:169 stop:348 length:180 start_codon:yes stop_codon:yes gene_type:complete
MATIGDLLTSSAGKVYLCDSGEVGKEFVSELQRNGIEVIEKASEEARCDRATGNYALRI